MYVIYMRIESRTYKRYTKFTKYIYYTKYTKYELCNLHI